MPKLEPDFSRWFVSLSMDALYLSVAKHHLERARLERRTVRRARQTLRALEADENELLRRGRRSRGANEAWESLAIQIVDGVIPEYEMAFRPYLESLAVTHICAAASIEAHLNRVGAERLGSAEFSHFDRLSLEGKWLTLPLLSGGTPIPASDYRYGRIRELAKTRNNLVHYKSRKEDWRQGRAPKFVKQLGLAYPEARRSVETATLAINAVAAMLGEDEPTWTSGMSHSYFVHTSIDARVHGA